MGYSNSNHALKRSHSRWQPVVLSLSGNIYCARGGGSCTTCLLARVRRYDIVKNKPITYVVPKLPKGGGLKNTKRQFPSKIAILWKKDCYKVSLCENRQQKRCNAFIDLSIGAQMTGGNVSFYVKFSV